MNGLTRAIGVRPGEARTIALVARLFASLEAGRGFGEIGVDTLVVSRSGAGSLPYLFIGLGPSASWPRWPTAPRSGACRGSRCLPGVLDRARPSPCSSSGC